MKPSRDIRRTGPAAYAELQAVSNFSFLRGASHPHELVAQAKGLGLSAIAIADHNSLAGVVRAHTAAKASGLKLIVGARLDLEDAPSLLCYPQDRQAYGRLSRLLSEGQGRAEKGKCSLRLADVASYAAGQIFLIVPPVLWQWADDHLQHLDSDKDYLEHEVRRIRRALSPASVYLAASYRYGNDDRAHLTALVSIGKRTGVPVVATGDVLYHDPGRRPLQDVLTCIREGVTIAEAGHRLSPNAERHLKSPAEVARLFKGFEDAIERTSEIVRSCRFSLDELKYEYPDEPVPPGKTPQAHLEALARAGAERRYPEGVPEKIGNSLDYELSLISELGYAPYFLTVNDIVAYAHANGILAQGRGSAANSVVCYCLGITSVDPTEIDLLFERFVSAERREPPDIDVDFEHERREEVIQFIYDRYGRDRAGIAATVISYRQRSAVREVGRAMGLSEDTVAALAGMVWGTRSGGALPDRYIREAGLDPDDPLLSAVITLADELIGFPRHLSQHVGGFVLTRGPLVEMVPVGNAAMDDRTFIEWDKDDIAALGLMKIDVLALGMLTCIRKAFALLEKHHGETVTLASVPPDDQLVYEMLCKADSIGVFQVESRAQMNMLPRLKPKEFYDLVIEVAIVRPGPIQGDMVHPYLRRRSGLERELYPSPSPEFGDEDELRAILSKTRGVPLFQEQAMRIAMQAAKFTHAEVNELRKAMATFRRRGTIGQLEEKMVGRMVARGYDREFAARCFNQIKGFGEYGFPESHAASFALLVYVSAWLKCRYPAAFACSLLNSQPMGFYAPAQIVRDARDHGVEIREVDINHSDWDSTLEMGQSPGGPALRLGLRLVDGLSKAEAERIMNNRQGHNGAHPFVDIPHLVRATGISASSREKLAAADCFRSLQLDRRQALWEVKGLSLQAPLPLFAWSETRETGQEPAVALPPMAESEHVVADYQTTKLSIKAHPMQFLRSCFQARKVLSCTGIRDLKDGACASVAGVVLVRQRPGSAKGVVFMTIEDETGIANIVVWSKTLERYRRIVMGSRLIQISGRIQRQQDIVHLVSSRLDDMSHLLARLADPEDGPVPVPIANADEVLHPEPGSARAVGNGKLRPVAGSRHPRLERIIPKSRDFH